MKRDMELARLILLAIERSADDETASIHLPTENYDDLHISQHVRLLKEGNLIHALESRSFNAVISWVPHSLTWQGHDFLEVIRDDAVWDIIKSTEKAYRGELPTEVIYELGLREVKKKIGLLS